MRYSKEFHVYNNASSKRSINDLLQMNRGGSEGFLCAVLSKISLIIHMLLLGKLMFFIDSAIYIEQVNCTIPYWALVFFYFGICLFYFASTLSKNCKGGNWSEVFFNLIPAELLLLVIFSSHHFIWSIVFLVIIVAAFCSTYLRVTPLRGVELVVVGQALIEKKQAAFRSFVTTVFVVLLIPACIALSYGFEAPVISANTDTPYQTSSSNAQTGSVAISSNSWERLNSQEKIDRLQIIVNSFCAKDKIEQVRVIAKPLPYEGGVDLEKKNVIIDLETLCTDDLDAVICSVLRGYYRCYRVSMTEENSGRSFQEIEDAFISERTKKICVG